MVLAVFVDHTLSLIHVYGTIIGGRDLGLYSFQSLSIFLPDYRWRWSFLLSLSPPTTCCSRSPTSHVTYKKPPRWRAPPSCLRWRLLVCEIPLFPSPSLSPPPVLPPSLPPSLLSPSFFHIPYFVPPVGYAWLPLMDSKGRVSSGTHNLAVSASLPSGYLGLSASSPQGSRPGVRKWRSNHVTMIV